MGILIFMSISLFSYVVFLKYYNMPKCPVCHSNKIIIKEFLNYRLLTCRVCKFSYKDYFLFYHITPIYSQVEIIILEYEEEDS